MGSAGMGALCRALCHVLQALGFSSEWPCSVTWEFCHPQEGFPEQLWSLQGMCPLQGWGHPPTQWEHKADKTGFLVMTRIIKGS